MTEHVEYEKIIENNPQLKGVISKQNWDQISKANEMTVGALLDPWKNNVKKNIESKRFRRHGSIEDVIEFGRNKAIIGIGAGSCLNKNKHVLKQIHDLDGCKPWDERDFIFIASNHMYKPLLKDGIIPDFVMLCDGSDVVLDQLTKDVPESGRNCVLIAGLQCSPKVLKRWEKQGRDIKFYLTGSEGITDHYKKITGNDPWPITMSQGGNVLNGSWTIGLRFFKSSVFMAVGNDLSYPIEHDIEKRRQVYYADGDYTSNAKDTGTGRDEAKHKHKWMGFSLSPTKILSANALKRYHVEIEPVLTNGNLWIYKTWLESHVIGNEGRFPFTYYNCTEGGIAGVMCRDDTEEGRDKIENWFLMDEATKKWRTRTLEDAAEEFLTAKKALRWGIPYAARNATVLETRI